MILSLIILSIWVLGLTYLIFTRKYQDDEVIDEDLEEDIDFEFEAPTRAENMQVISLAHELFEQSDPMIKSQQATKERTIKKCKKIAKRYVDEIYDETFYVEKTEENGTES
jgi:squalene cyclase